MPMGETGLWYLRLPEPCRSGGADIPPPQVPGYTPGVSGGDGRTGEPEHLWNVINQTC